MNSNQTYKRMLDIVICTLLLLILTAPFVILYLIVKLTSQGPAVHWSKRIGVNNQVFLMPKFRSMYIDTPQLSTDLLYSVADKYITPIGKILRKTSLDELPQIWSILKGDMSLVGPRPALFNQYHLIDLRTKKMVHTLRPGLTGWAQINGRDTVTDDEKVDLDVYYLKNQSVWLDLKIMMLTVSHVMKSTDITH